MLTVIVPVRFLGEVMTFLVAEDFHSFKVKDHDPEKLSDEEEREITVEDWKEGDSNRFREWVEPFLWERNGKVEMEWVVNTYETKEYHTVTIFPRHSP